MKSKLLVFVLGLIVGLAVALALPRLLAPYLPTSLWSWAGSSEGVVEAKRWDDQNLLLTLVTEEGATLATFSRRVSQIDLLIDEGDQVTFAGRKYQPFVEDPVIGRVLKGREAEPEAEPEVDAVEPSWEEAGPRPEESEVAAEEEETAGEMGDAAATGHAEEDIPVSVAPQPGDEEESPSPGA